MRVNYESKHRNMKKKNRLSLNKNSYIIDHGQIFNTLKVLKKKKIKTRLLKTYLFCNAQGNSSLKLKIKKK